MSRRDDGETSSQRSGASGNSGNMSETSSQQYDVKFLRKRALRAQHGAEQETDLLEQKRNFQEGVFACMYTLVRQSALSQLAFSVLKIVLEFLMGFIVAFNPSFKSWKIDTASPVWQVIRWTLWRSPIMRLYGYKPYVIVMYIMATAVFLSVIGLVWLTLAMRKQEQSKLLRKGAWALHVVFDVMFIMCYVSFFDYFVFMADCDFLGPVKKHLYFTDVMCLEMPHLVHLLVALATAVMFQVVTALLVVASADLNPVARGYLSTPAALVRLRILFAKAAYIVFADCLDSNPRLQCLGMTATVVLILYWNFRGMPFYRGTVNVIWTGLWTGVLYTCVVLCVVTFGGDQSDSRLREMTKLVLYGIFPAIAAGVALTAVFVWWSMRPAGKFREVPPGVKLSKVHKFESVYEVERLARVMRKFDLDGLAEEDAAALGETIIKAGLQTFANAPHLLILYANFVLEVRKDGPAARTQLQLAAKHAPNIIQRYQIFCTYEASKRLKGSQQDCMDLQAYIEFKRNFRAVLRVHREVLMMQAEVWQLCIRPSLRVAQFDSAMDALEAAAVRAHNVYKRVIERYPNNGKLLRCYGKFLEDARHDHLGAMRVYAEANRSGAGGAALLSLDLSSGLHGGDKPDFLTSMSLEEDAVVVIDAEGTIMMVSQTVQKTFGYPKAELEGSNVSMLMPQPFSQRHDGYLQRYVATAEPHILDSVREVVALHKERYVFPVALCVTRLSGVGADSIFLGVIRPLPPDIYNLRAWVAPNGVFLCSDQQFASSIGAVEGELVGHPLSSLVNDSDAAVVEALLERCRLASAAELAAGEITSELLLKHRYQEPVPVHLTVRLAGTDAQRILVFHCRRMDCLDGSMLAVDTHMRIKFASCEVALLLGYSMRKLATMRLDQLLPQPFNALHAKWLRDPPHAVPPASCRSGAVVHLLSEAGAPIPVRVKISTMDGALAGIFAGSSTLYVVQVRKVIAEELVREKRLVLTADFAGRVQAVSPPDSSLFDFPAASLVGTNLAESVDLFADWRERSGETQMQLIVLALLYKEQEMPGTSWRVRVQAPPAVEGGTDAAAAAQPKHSVAGYTAAGAVGSRRASVSACLQVEMQDDDGADVEVAMEDEAAAAAATAAAADGGGGARDHEPRVRITLWRRDLLSGVVELDEELLVRRASPLTGLITGIPTTAMLRKPLSRFLDFPHVASWAKLVAASGRQGHGHHKKSALKATTDRGSISPVMAFIGPHPDSGTMRLMVQGVQTLGPGGRPKVTLTLHPDTTFIGAHANLMRVLKLDEGANRRASNSGMEGADDEDGALSTAAAAATGVRSRALSALPSRRAHRMKSRKQPQQAAEAEAWDDGAAGEAAAAPAGGAAAGAEPLQSVAGLKADADLGVTTDADDGGGVCGRGPRKGGNVEEDEEEEEASGEDGGGAEGKGADHVGGKRGKKKDTREGSGGSAEEAEEEEEDDEAGGPGASLHRQATSKSEFVAQWVRTLSHQISGAVDQSAEQRQREQQPQPQPLQGTASGRRAGSGALLLPSECARPRLAMSAAGPDNTSARLATITEGSPGVVDSSNDAAAVAGGQGEGALLLARAASMRRDWADACGPRAASLASRGIEVSRRSTMHDEAVAAAGAVKAVEKPPSESGDSSADGSQAAGSMISSATDATSVSECVIDTRRGRLLKGLSKLLLGPALMTHVDRLRLHSYLLIAIMFTAHVISYSVITQLIRKEHTYVYNVHRQAMAMDRSQLIIVRSIVGTFCERANVTEKVSICANSLSFTLSKLQTNIDLMEDYHQGVYLGFDASKITKLQTDVYDIWTKRNLEYHVFMDTTPPQVLVEKAGAWQLGNRFLAAAREAAYLLHKLGDMYKHHRTYQFIKSNGLGPLFEGYAASLNLLVDAAWLSIAELKRDLLITLIVEAIVVQLCCTIYELYLVQRTEWARLLGVLAILGLPGPVLRQLANSNTRVVGDSDDESDDDDDSRAGEDEAARAGGGGRRDGGGAAGGGGEGFGKSASDAAAAAASAAGATALLQGPPPRTQGGGDADAAGGSRFPEFDGKLSGAAEAAGSGGPGAAPPPLDEDEETEEEEAAAPKGSIIRPRSSTPDGAAEEAAGPGRRQRTAAAAAAAASSSAGPAAPAPLRLVSPGKGARAKAAASVTAAKKSSWLSSASRLQINGKALQPSLWNVSKFMVPFLLWNVAVILVYAVSLMKLDGMQGPLASLNMASHVTYRYTRVRAIGAAFVTQDDAASRAVWRPLLLNELDLLESEYNAVMYGGEPTSMVTSTFRRMVPAGTFASSSFSQAFFRSKTCFRYDKSTCFPPGHEYYEVTHNGLDVMVRRMLSEMRLLAADDDTDVAYNNSRYTFMAAVAANDLYEGLQQATQLFVDYSIARYDEVALLHTILLVVSVVLLCGFFLFVLWPHIRLLLRDAARLGALLSLVPPEMDVRAHVRGVLRRTAGGGRARKTAAASAAMMGTEGGPVASAAAGGT